LDILTGTPPAPFDAGERYFGTDLAFMSMAALKREERIAGFRLLLDERPSWWWLERYTRVQEELRRRG
jgi:hypothetical protein